MKIKIYKERRYKMSEEKQENIEKEEKNNNKDMVPKQDYDELDDRYKRILAEFENSKKRNSKEKERLYSSLLSEII